MLATNSPMPYCYRNARCNDHQNDHAQQPGNWTLPDRCIVRIDTPGYAEKCQLKAFGVSDMFQAKCSQVARGLRTTICRRLGCASPKVGFHHGPHSTQGLCCQSGWRCA